MSDNKTSPACPICAKTFDTPRGLSVHQSKVHKTTSVTKHACAYCQKTFATRQSLSQHTKRCKQKSSYEFYTRIQEYRDMITEYNQTLQSYEDRLTHQITTSKDVEKIHEVEGKIAEKLLECSELEQSLIFD